MLPDDPRRRRSTRQPIPHGYSRTPKPVKRDSTRQPTSRRYSNTNKVENRANYAVSGYVQVIKKENEQLRQDKKTLSGIVEVSEKKRYRERQSRRTQATVFLLLWVCLGAFIVGSFQNLPVGVWITFGIGVIISLFCLLI